MYNHIFENINSEKDIAKLKRFLITDSYFKERIFEIRKKINNKVDPSGTMPNNPEVLRLYYELLEENKIQKNSKLELLLKRLKVRSNSGVAVVSLLTKPYTCPGRCIYCPTEKNMPKSYLSREPAAARALHQRFDPYKQIETRLKALTLNGHPVDKIEMIIIGGTFNFYEKEYQEWFVKECFRVCNNWGVDQNSRDFISKDHNYSLEKLQEINQKSQARIIGLSIETRPDYITPNELKWLRYLGVTKVELGVQHLDDKVLEFNKREMTKEAIAYGTEMLRNYGFKVVYHMMPNLPLSNPEMDIKMFEDLYNSKSFHPDMMKIYPCMVLRGSLLYKLVTQNKIDYKAYDDKLLTYVLSEAEKRVAPYTRLIRVIRDIPADYIIVGSKKSNLREEVDRYLKNEGFIQKDIRAREIRDLEIDPKDFELTEIEYETESGKEIFLQFENKKENKLAGFLRLRLPYFNFDFNKKINRISSKNWGIENWEKKSEEFLKDKNFEIDKALDKAALVRELHVYGTLKKIGEKGNQSQHTGFGKRLLERAEEIAKKNGYKKISIISGVGVREYYAKRGYNLEGTYMVKYLM